MAPPPPAGQQKSRRPVLSPHVAHAHAFAAVPSPGAPKSAGSSYFPLPNPPAPLRTFTLAQNDAGALDANTSYPTSGEDPAQHARISVISGKKSQEANSTSPNAPRQAPDASPKSPTARTPSSGSRHQFAPAPFSVSTPNRSWGFSSSSSASAKSALSIAEIDCFFVQGSRSSAYSAAHSNSSSQSRPPSEPGGGPAPLSELGLSSNEEAGSGDKWMSDEAERERQREERKAFMKARKNLREEARRMKRLSAGGQIDDTHTATWREAIQAQAVMPLKGIPESRAGSSRGASASGSPRGSQHAKQSAEPLANMLTAPPLPSGPGPPPESDAPVETLAASLSESMTISGGIPEGQASNGPTPPADGAPPTLNRFDSGKTAVGIPAIPQPDTHPS
ncbi:unnamed protein product [Rhizoctonia solani]|uniref:Uncharacterized protein n=1 Tax=Rhizoctonia solani TaxID=456999 RepID=A0A8H3HGP6_9AGAM|nr:unnamed protein product [Rhizoctonia solani]